MRDAELNLRTRAAVCTLLTTSNWRQCDGNAIAQKFPATQIAYQLGSTDIAARIVQVAPVRLEQLSWLLMAENNCIVLLQLP